MNSGETLGPYRVLGKLGEGGMGEVYRATDTRLRRTVAVKILKTQASDGDEGRRRLEREARAIAALDHPHICAVYDIGRDRDIDYLVMQLVEGDTLADRLRRGPLAVGEALECARQTADALAAAHHAGVLHRDVKPANIKLTSRGVMLLDFGIAAFRPRLGDEATTATAGEPTIAGTVAYMAPEALEGRVDERSDVFSLGAVLYELLAGQRAFTGDSAWRVAAAIMNDVPAPVSIVRPGVPRLVDTIVARAMAKQPSARWQSAADLRAALETCLLALGALPVSLGAPPADEPGATEPHPAIAASGTSVPRRPWPIWATVSADVILATLLVSAAWPLLIALEFHQPLFALVPVALGLVAGVAGVGVFLWRPWGRRAQQALAAAGLIVFPVGTVIGAAALSYFARPGVRLLFSDTSWPDLSADQRDRARVDAQVPRRWLVLLPAIVLAALVPTILLSGIMVPSLLRARVSANEASAIGSLRTLLSAESLIARYNQGFYVPAECLFTPSLCLPGYAGGAVVRQGAFASAQVDGYLWQLHPGMRLSADEIRRTGASPQSLQSVAVTMVPFGPGQTGIRAFCGDSSGQLCEASDGKVSVDAGRCTGCKPLH